VGRLTSWVFFDLGDRDMETLFWIAGLVCQAIFFGTIFRKAGYSGWLGLFMVLPPANLIILWWFATSTWPLEMGYTGQDKNTLADDAWELKIGLRQAAKLEKDGRIEEAIKQLERVAERAGKQHPKAKLARERIRQIQTKVGRPAESDGAPDQPRE
jgi:hypothetical protein